VGTDFQTSYGVGRLVLEEWPPLPYLLENSPSVTFN
jgi:hypothetical protein